MFYTRFKKSVIYFKDGIDEYKIRMSNKKESENNYKMRIYFKDLTEKDVNTLINIKNNQINYIEYLKNIKVKIVKFNMIDVRYTNNSASWFCDAEVFKY